MKFGLLYEIQIPGRRTADSESRAYQEALEQIVLADQLGWDHVWAVEHHLLPGWSHSSAPEVFFGALTQRTSRIRIGHGVALLPKGFNHPFRVAERVATLDILSGGRAELGTGRAVTLQELDGFEVEPDETKDMWLEAIQIVTRAFRDEPVEWNGKYWNIPSSYVVPKPVQKPHPPMWLAGTNPETFVTAGERGLGMLGFVTGRPDEVAPRIAAYKDAVAKAEPIADAVNDQAAVLIQTYCAPTTAQAIEDAEPAVAASATLAAELFLPWAQQPQRRAESYRYLTQRPAEQTRAGAEAGTGAVAAPSLADRAKQGIVAFGSPDDILRTLGEYERMGVDQMIMWVQFGGLEHRKIMDSLALLGKHVLPEMQRG